MVNVSTAFCICSEKFLLAQCSIGDSFIYKKKIVISVSELQLKTYVENGLLIMYDQLLEYMKGYRDHQFKFFIHFLDLLVSIFKCYHLSVG